MTATATTLTMPLVKRLRLERKFNHRKLSRRAGIHIFTIESMEAYGSPALPNEQEALSRFFGCPVDQLFHPDGKPKTTVVTLESGRPVDRKDEK